MNQKKSQKVKENVKENEEEYQIFLNETINYNKLVELLKSNVITNMTKGPQHEWPVRDFKILLELYMKQGSVQRFYKPSNEHKEGRLYAKDGMGIQMLSKEIRSYLCKDDYLDLDISNCAPSIILQMMKDDFKECELLQDYINNKNRWRNQYPDAKNLIIQQINDKDKLRKTKFDELNKLLLSIYNYVKRKSQSDSKSMYDQITRIERVTIDNIMEYCKSYKIKIIALMFDGLIIEKIDNSNDLVQKINAFIDPYEVEIKSWDLNSFAYKMEIPNMQKFDYNDPIVYDDLINLSGTEYLSEDHFYMKIIPYLIKTTRFIDDTLLTKSVLYQNKDSYKMHKKIKDQNFFVTYYSKSKRYTIHMTEILTRFRNLISFKVMTPFRFNLKPYEFSTDCGFLCSNDILPSDWESRLDKFKYHILNVCSRGNEVIANGFYYFFANIIQTDDKSQVLMVMTGKEGSGKSIIPTWFINKILGSSGLIISTLNEITGKFNSHLANKRMVLINEMSNIDSIHKHTDNDVLKNIIDAPCFNMELKGHDKIQVPNFIEFIGASNYKYCITQSDGMGRRNYVIEVDNKYSKDDNYFSSLIEYLNDQNNIRSIFEFLRTYNISDKLTLKHLPISESKATGIYKSLSPVMKGLLIACRVNNDQNNNGIVRIKRKDLYNIMRSYNLIDPQEYKINKLSEYIREQISDKIISIISHARVLSYDININEFKYDNKIWESIDEIIKDKQSLHDEYEDQLE